MFKRFFSSKPMRWAVLLGLVFLLMPVFFSSGKSLNLISQVGIATVFALSFNMLLGQTGMLSFGHAVYSGLGGFVAVHAMNKISDGSLNFPMSLIPLIGGFAGALFGIAFGWIASKKSGITFSMISLGIGELVFASALMFPSFFGGEGGISANRVSGDAFFGITFGPQIEVCYLIVLWTLGAVLTMYFIQKTPLGQLAAAVRDNAERVAFMGFDPRWIRFLMLVLSGFFAGIAGALSVINFEMASAENLSAMRSGTVLLFTYIGGISFFLGPIVGAVLGVLLTVFLSELTPAWQLYMGILFILVVVKAPRGLCGLAVDFFDAYQRARVQASLTYFASHCCLFTSFASLLSGGGILLIEMLYRLRFQTGSEQIVVIGGLAFDPRSVSSWSLIVVFIVASIGIKIFIAAQNGVKQRGRQ